MARVIPELILHWLWQRRLYAPESLFTTRGAKVEVLTPGRSNPEAGPDFVGVEVRIDGLRWIGAVEIDAGPNLWYAHRHHENPLYRTVILHVVWEAGPADVTVDLEGREIPILPLAPVVPAERLQAIWTTRAVFPCAGIARLAPAALWHALYDRWGEARLRARHRTYADKQAFFQAFWEALAYSYGAPDGEPYRRLAEAISWATLVRYAEGLLSKEAALLGMAGLLEGVAPPQDPYEERLLTTWHYLQQKHGWRPLALRWKPTRPPASPYVRLAMLAALVETYPRPDPLLEALPAALPLPSAYWCTHWAWQRLLPVPLRRPSPAFLHKVAINAVYPFAMYYHRLTGRLEKALEVLERFRVLPAENHRYARLYARWAYPAENAWQTQGQLQLWREACLAQRCLTCEVGHYLLKGADPMRGNSPVR